MSRTIESGDTQIISVQSAAGFSPGDYIYATRSGYAPLTGIPINTLSTVFAGAVTPVTAVTTGVSNLIGPIAVSGSYSGTTATPVAVISGPTTPATSSVSILPQICALSGGNFVFIRVTSPSSGTGSIYATVYSSAGAVVTAETLLVSGTVGGSSGNSVGIAPTPDNGFVLVWTTGSFLGSALGKFTATLAASWTVTFTSFYSAYPRVACNASGVIFVALVQGNTPYYAMFSSSGATLKSVTAVTSPTTYSPGTMNCVAGTNGDFYVSAYDFSSNQYIARYSGSTYLYVSSYTTSNGQGNYHSLVAYPSGNIGHLYINSSAVNVVICPPALGSAVTQTISAAPTAIVNSGSYTPTTGNWAFSIDPVNDRVVGIAPNTSAYTLAFSQSSGTAATSSATSTTLGTNPSSASSCSLSPSGVLGIVTSDSSGGTNRLYFVYATPTTFTNGSTPVSGSITYPTYTFVGVAVTGCTAGGTGKVLIKGTANVGSGYGSVSGSLGFDLTSSGSPTANKGVISGRTITLQGF